MAATPTEPNSRQEHRQGTAQSISSLSQPPATPHLSTSSSSPAQSQQPLSHISPVATPSPGPAGALPKRRASFKSMAHEHRGSSRSSHGSSSSVMPGSVDPDHPVRLTPVTHRVSKAKKGLKVHVCEHDGCGKIYTRAEHLKRHEANHRDVPLLTCEVCQKPFQRRDLLSRHLEKQHEIRSASGSTSGRRSRRCSSSQASSVTTSSQAQSPAPTTAGGGSPAMEMAAITHPSTPMSIQSIIAPNPGHGFSAHFAQTWNNGSSMGIAPPGSLTQDLADSLYPRDDTSSDGSTYSPASEGLQNQIRPQAFWPQYYPTNTSALHLEDFPTQSHPVVSSSTSSYSDWGEYGITQPFNGLSIGLERQFPASVDAPPRTTLPFMERDGRTSLRSESTSAASMASGQGRVVNLDDETLQHYYECYKRGFHSFFPILHYPTLVSSSPPPPLLNAMILAIGAQLSPRPLSKWHSISIFEAASKLLANLLSMISPITTQTRLSDLQSIFLAEIFALYRSRSPGVYHSAVFDTLYSILLNDAELLNPNPATIEHLGRTPSHDNLQTVYRQWIDLEARRRLLLAAFVFDTHSSILFSKPPRHIFPSPEGPNLPRISPAKLWACPDLMTWCNLVPRCPSLSVTSAPKDLPLSAFHTSIQQCLTIHYSSLRSSESASGPLPRLPPSDFTHHVLLLATQTPILSLLIVAAESWLFSRKVTDSNTWTMAKTELRIWVDSEAAAKAAWHANQLLRNVFGNSKLPDENGTGMGLHEEWCLYLAALVCWAYGFSPQAAQVQDPRSLDPQQREALLWGYLNAVDGQNWRRMHAMRGIGLTTGVLECVRARMQGGARMGKLVCEGEDVLRRLVEGRSRLCWF